MIKSKVIYDASEHKEISSLSSNEAVTTSNVANAGVEMRNPGVRLAWRKRLGFLCLSLSLTGVAFFFSPYIAGKMAQEKRKGFAPLIAGKTEPALSLSKGNKVEEVNREEIRENSEATEVKNPVKKEDEPINSFYLTIEKIGLHSALVIPEIDANNNSLYEQALRSGLVHAQNSALPDESGLVYIFGHSANYPWIMPRTNGLFFKLDKVEIGDKVKIEYNGKHFLYHVFDKKIVNPDDLDSIKDKTDEDVLVLQSCYPLGTALKRLLLFARPSKLGALIY